MKSATFRWHFGLTFAHQADIEFHCLGDGFQTDALVITVNGGALCGGQIHGLQCVGHGLVGTPVQDADQMAVMSAQRDHLLLKCSKLQIILA